MPHGWQTRCAAQPLVVPPLVNATLLCRSLMPRGVHSREVCQLDLRDDACVCEAPQERQQGGRLIGLLERRQQGALGQLVVVVRRVERPEAAHRLIEVPARLVLL